MEEDLFNEKDLKFNENDLLDGFDESYERSPSNMDYSTFKIRNDTEELLFRIRLHLLNAYKFPVVINDETTGEKTVIYKVKQMKGTKPLANKQGIAEIMNYIENYVNGHSVQTNFIGVADWRKEMLFINSNMIIEFQNNNTKWGMSPDVADGVQIKIRDLIGLFLRRGIDNKERESYSEGHKETTHREIKNEEKPSLLERWGRMLTGSAKK